MGPYGMWPLRVGFVRPAQGSGGSFRLLHLSVVGSMILHGILIVSFKDVWVFASFGYSK